MLLLYATGNPIWGSIAGMLLILQYVVVCTLLGRIEGLSATMLSTKEETKKLLEAQGSQATASESTLTRGATQSRW